MIGRELKGIYKGQMVPTVWAFDPPSYGLSVLGIKGVQKGDAQWVVVFHTSPFGFQNNIGDVDIIVNGGKNQPGKNLIFHKNFVEQNFTDKNDLNSSGCELAVSKTICSHYAAFTLRQLILMKSNLILKNDAGIPIALDDEYKADKLPLELTNPTFGKHGVYEFRTGKVFEIRKEAEEKKGIISSIISKVI